MSLCLEAKDVLAEEGINARVVSMPSFELFEQQDEAYKAMVLPGEVRARVAVEAGTSLGWGRYGFGSEARVREQLRDISNIGRRGQS